MATTPVRAVLTSLFAVVLLALAPSAAPQSITTYHYDNKRTGWNSNETILTPANVNSSDFGLLHNVTLDDQVDGQPLYMPGINITAGSFQGTHNVVYVASEGDTVYAIDAQTGTILLSTSLGTPIPQPLGCNNNGPNVGINSTPVIDPTTNTLYVMVYTKQTGSPQYFLHALDLGSLADKVSPQMVTASHTLSNGTKFNFNATYQRQRPGLLLANGNVYAGYGSFCDFSANLSRGWLLGWQAGTLTPLAANDLFDDLATSPDSFFLSSIWMSGYAPATDDSGNILVVTGNSDYSGTTYNGTTNIQESTVKLSADLTTVLDLFTPSDQASLDQSDGDFGSGGVMVLPDQGGSDPHLAVAAGKDGNLYFMDEDSLGGYSTTKNNVLGTYNIGGCWCGQSYFVDPGDSISRVVTSGGGTVRVFQVLTSGSSPSLNQVAQSSGLSSSGSGFFTSISSNGTSNAIIWALSRPGSPSAGNVHLYAFNPDSGSTLQSLFNASAGYWPNTTGNSNLVPVVADGEVFVASYQQLQIFGLNNPTTTTSLTSSANPSAFGQPVTLTAQVSSSGGSEATGTVTFSSGSNVLGTSQLNSSGAATLALTTAQLPVGSQSITAAYGGDATHGTSESNVLTQVVNKATISITLTSSPNPSAFGKAVKFTATLTSNGSLPTGTLTFSYNGTTLGSATITGGVANRTVSTLPAGSDLVTASFAGSANYSPASGSVTQVVDSTTTTLTSSLNPSNFGQAVTLTAHVTSTGSTTPTGKVTFKNGTAILGTVTLNSSGTATLTTSNLPVGSDSLIASYSGDAANNKSTSQALTQVVNQATITMTLKSSPNPSTKGQSVTFTATLASNGSLPTGTVTFSSNGTTLGQKSIVGGVATFSTKTLPQGTDAVTATYAGSTKFSAASATVNQTVN
jgi:hypothetical protein